MAGGSFLLLGEFLSEADFFAWGWRIPFLASSVLVIFGLYIRLKIHETPVFQATIDKQEQVKVPMFTVFQQHGKMLFIGTCIALATFVLFYLVTVFSLTWGTTQLGYSREHFLILQLIAIFFFALCIPISALLADRYGRRLTLGLISLAIAIFGMFMAPLFNGGNDTSVLLFLIIGLGLMGLTYGPLGTILSELFPTNVRYTGASLTFNLAGIFGASLAPYAAMWLGTHYGISAVGHYLSIAALITLIALLFTHETKDRQLAQLK